MLWVSQIKGAARWLLSGERTMDLLRKSRLRSKSLVLMYHEIAPCSGTPAAWMVVTDEDFREQMDYLGRHFAVVSLPEGLAAGHQSRDGRPLAMVTFDDGYAGMRQSLLPYIESTGLPVTIFVATRGVLEGRLYWYDRIINALDRDEVIEIDLGRFSLGRYRLPVGDPADRWRETERLLSGLKSLDPSVREFAAAEVTVAILPGAGGPQRTLAYLTVEDVMQLSHSPFITLGAHSHSHEILTQLDADAARASIVMSKSLLEEWTGKTVTCFSYPNGNYSRTVASIVRETGFTCAVTTESRPWAPEDSPYAIPRFGIGRFDPSRRFRLMTAGVNL